MSHKPQSPAIIIKRQHQSRPKAHWADKEIRKAAVEIDEGRYVEPARGEGSIEKLNVGLGFGDTPIARRGFVTHEEAVAEYGNTDMMNRLGRHPRVVEAMERMQREVEELTNPQEIVEKKWMLHEMNQCHSEKNKWDGQNRWEGREHLEARMQGQDLTPMEFHERLCKVIGPNRVLLSPHGVRDELNPRAYTVGLYIPNPLWEGEPMIKPFYAAQQAGELRKAAEKEIVYAKNLRGTGHTVLADKAFHRAGDMIQTATEILQDNSVQQQLKEPELLRAATLQGPLGTEWMVMRFDEYGVPTTAMFTGWRTALLTMVRSKIVTEVEAQIAFPLGVGDAAEWFMEQMYMLRNPQDLVN